MGKKARCSYSRVSSSKKIGGLQLLSPLPANKLELNDPSVRSDGKHIQENTLQNIYTYKITSKGNHAEPN